MSRRGAVVFLHGSGDTGPGVREWLESASGGKFRQRIAELGLGTAVFPTAPVRRYTLAGGMPSTVWFDREDLSPSSLQDRAGVFQSLQLVENEVKELEVGGVPRSGIFVGGFSMGGGLALELLGKQALLGGLAGVFSLSSFLSDDSPAFETSPWEIPVYVSHGEEDSMVKIDWGRTTAERLRGKGFDVRFAEHEGLGHEIGGEQITGLLDWISGVMKRSNFGGGGPTVEGRDGVRCSPVIKGEASDGPPSAKKEGDHSVSYELTELGKWQCLAAFSVPPGSEKLLSGASICARGSFFQLETVPGTPGKVTTSFLSPKPELTAAAIAARIEQRLSDPRPPGMEEACCVS